MLNVENQTEHFDIAKDDEMDDLRGGAIQPLSATTDDAEEQHKQHISQVSKRLSSEQIADLHERAQRARQLDERDEWQSVVSSKSSNYDDLPPLEDLQPKIVSILQKARARLELKRFIDEDKDSPEPKRVSRLQKARVRLKLKRCIDEDKDSPEPMEIKEAEKRTEQKMDNADSSSTIPAGPSRRSKDTIDYSTDMEHWDQTTNVQEGDLLYQLHLRGLITEEQEKEYIKQKKKGRGRGEAGRAYLLRLVEKLVNSGKWTTRVNDELLRKVMEDWRDMKGKGKATREK